MLKRNFFLNVIILLSAALFGWWFSTFIYSYYVSGDLGHYKNFWDASRNADLYSALRLQLSLTGSQEPIYGLMVYYLSASFEKASVLTVINMILCVQVAFILLREKAKIYIYPLVFSNYYFIVLLGPAERLKCASVIFLMYFVVSFKHKWIFLILSIFSHMQMAISSMLVLVDFYFDKLKTLSTAKKIFYSLAYFVAALGVAIIIYGRLRSGFESKVTSYGQYDILESFTSLILLILSMWMFKDKLKTIFLFAPLAALSALLGSSRINMIAFLLFFALSLREQKTGDIRFLIVMAYLSYKSIGFIGNVVNYGTGYI